LVVTKLLTVAEMADHLRLSRWAIYSMARDGRLPVIRLSRRRLRFDPAAVAEALRRSAPMALTESKVT
jgi:excisionase family DNA binding protein